MRTYAHTYVVGRCTYTYAYIHTNTHIYIYIYIYKNNMRTYAHTYVVSRCTYTYAYIHTNIYIYIYVCMHVWRRDLKLRLFQAFCTSFYCAHLWNKFIKQVMSKVRVAYNNVFRLLFGLAGYPLRGNHQCV